jgi:thiol-disulfide isomerase/thioredoxin
MMFANNTFLRRALLFAALMFPISSTHVWARAKFEPAKGAYLGAFIETDGTVRGNIATYETLTRKKHASYFTYVGYGCPFPGDFVAKVKRAGAVPHLAFEPNYGLEEVKDGPYLRAWARDAARTKVPIFLRWASEMNGPWTAYGKDPALYIEKFRLVAKVMREEAPNVAMLWTPFCEPTKYIDPYYPGDAHVDWVGVNIYSVYVNNGDPSRPAWDKDPIDFLRYVYENYASRKPIHISEFAATLHCKGTSLNTVDFAIEKIRRFYDGVRQSFPRVKSVNYFCLDTVKAGLANNNYSFLQDGRVLNVYNEAIAHPHYLSKVTYKDSDFPAVTKSGTTIGVRGIKIRPSSDELAMLANSGSVAANLTEPTLRGVRNGEIVADDFQLSVQLPLNLSPRGLLWQIDGRTFAITNAAPYRVNVSKDRWGPGRHTVRVIVLGNDDMSTQIPSPPVEFEFAP